MDVYEVIKRPLVTEKSTHQATELHEATHSRPARGGCFAFEVHLNASKPVIRQAVEKIYNVKVRSVRTSIRQGKRRRYRFKIGRTRRWKKAVVVLDAGGHIDLF